MDKKHTHHARFSLLSPLSILKTIQPPKEGADEKNRDYFWLSEAGRQTIKFKSLGLIQVERLRDPGG